MGDGPINDLFEFVHTAADVDVLSMDASQTEHGLSMIDPRTGRVVIAVATTPHPIRQRSSIAHELGHVVAGDLDRPESLTPGERSPEEIRADAFARHLLVPLEGARRRLSAIEDAPSLAHLSDLVQEFEVSPVLAAIQLRTLGLIDKDTCADWCSLSTPYLAARYGWLSQYRSLVADSERPRAPQGLMARAVEGYRRGLLGIAEVALWYGQDTAELQEQLDPHEAAVHDDWDNDWDSDAPLFPGERGEPAP